MFSFSHIFMIVLIALACLAVAWFYSASWQKKRFERLSEDGLKKNPAAIFGKISEKQHLAAIFIGLVLFISDIIYYIVLLSKGALDIYNLPLHLCGMTLYLVFIHSLFPWDWLGQILYALCLPGAWCAIIFPDWLNHPFFSYPSLRCYIAHGLMVIYIIMQTSAGIIRPRLSAIWKPVVFLCIIAPFIILINNSYGANYMFLSMPAKGSPLDSLYAMAGGNASLYILYFGILTILGMTAMYLPFAVYHLLHRRKT